VVSFWLQVYAANNDYPIGDAEISGAEYWIPDSNAANSGAYWVEVETVGATVSVGAPNYQTLYATVGSYANQSVYLTWIGAWPQNQTY